ncbi:hypothetical protein CHCC20441_4387 [Bacillus licheniformis]|nr:hypothetical protein B4164_0352 [Bacillus licheniformis]TWN08197.1 hypothetical protein CHCC14564_2709 [Bacillus licheniformis LMG 17339]OLF93317.1 hypothetical protein B4094_2203 [Bacillus licheniformis]OLG03166.1 hypothetical protein B4124_2494 [Bacillus licheniformis]TWJ38222.1 hypothetical protein CHCC5025_0495 [Bacillus licheniformis]
MPEAGVIAFFQYFIHRNSSNPDLLKPAGLLKKYEALKAVI